MIAASSSETFSSMLMPVFLTGEGILKCCLISDLSVAKMWYSLDASKTVSKMQLIRYGGFRNIYNFVICLFRLYSLLMFG